MQTTKRTSDEPTCPISHKANGAEDTVRSKQRQKNNSAKRCCYSFLKTQFTDTIPKFIIKDGIRETYNIITQENYEYLRDSYLRYAELLGKSVEHYPSQNIGESITQIFYDMSTLLADNIGVNIEHYDGKLYFNLWKYHQWGNDELIYFPIKFLEYINPELKRISITFINRMMRENGIDTIADQCDTECVLDWIETDDSDVESKAEWRKRNKICKSYKEGKIYNLLKHVERKSYYKDLPNAIRRYKPQNRWEVSLISLMEEGLAFMIPEKSIMHYGYDPYYDDDPDYYPMTMDRQIRVVYDLNDIVSNQLIEYFNSEYRETYAITPITTMPLSPDTDNLFSMEDDYPERFIKWADRFIEIISKYDKYDK